MDEQGIDRAIMWPTLASVLEERLHNDPEASHAIIHSLNQWMYEEWTFNYEDRIFATPVITLPIVAEAIRELDWVVEHGAKIILIRPAPVPSLKGFRSFALPEFDPFWAKVQEYDVTVGMHASDDGLTRYFNQWEGHHDEHLPFANTTAFGDVQHHVNRGIFDAMASAVCHGMLTRFPGLRVLPVENGSSWVLPLINALGHSYAKQPRLYEEDPVAVLRRNVWIHPFFEENPLGLIKAIGTDRVVFGSDLPAPGGSRRPGLLRQGARQPARGGHPEDHGWQPGRGAQRRGLSPPGSALAAPAWRRRSSWALSRTELATSGSAVLDRRVGGAGEAVADCPCAILGYVRVAEFGPARTRPAIVTEVR